MFILAKRRISLTLQENSIYIFSVNAMLQVLTRYFLFSWEPTRLLPNVSTYFQPLQSFEELSLPHFGKPGYQENFW